MFHHPCVVVQSQQYLTWARFKLTLDICNVNLCLTTTLNIVKIFQIQSDNIQMSQTMSSVSLYVCKLWQIPRGSITLHRLIVIQNKHGYNWICPVSSKSVLSQYLVPSYYLEKQRKWFRILILNKNATNLNVSSYKWHKCKLRHIRYVWNVSFTFVGCQVWCRY